MTDDAKKTKLKYHNGTVSVDKDECVRAGNKILNDALSGAQKPREWLFVGNFISQRGGKYVMLDGPDLGGAKVWLVEKSAYQKLEQELKEMHFAYAKAKTELYKAKAEIARLLLEFEKFQNEKKA